MSVFGALNRFIARLDSDGPPQSSSGAGRGACGFQVLRNKNEDVPLEPWYDFIVGINGRQIDNPDPHLFSQEVRNCAGSAVTLTLWSAKGQQARDISLPIPSPSPTLGVTLQWTPLAITDDVWHILEVIPDSPADQAGLLPYGDYIIGTPEALVRGEAGLGELVEDYLSRPLRLWVYNHEYGVTRLVTITPSRSWGGEGALGCILGFGALHHLPPSLAEPPAAPGDTLFETARFSNEETRPRSASPSKQQQQYPSTNYHTSSSSLLVPASMAAPPPPLTTTSPDGTAAPVARAPPRKSRQAGGASPSRAFDQMWEESEEKSREVDFAPSTTKATPPPPPPKIIGGTKGGGEEQSQLSVPSPPTATTPTTAEERRQTRSPDPIIEDDDID